MRKGILLGAHTSIAGGVSRALAHAREAGCDVVQIFTKNQRQWRAAPLDPDEVERWHAMCEETGVLPASSHSSYLINLSARDRSTLGRSRHLMLDEVDRADQLSIPCVVFHPGSHLGAGVATGVRRVARSLDWIYRRRPQMSTTLCLECTAGQGTNLGRTFEELAAIIGATEQGARLGICLDSCHLLAAGYDIRSRRGWDETLRAFDETVGIERLRCMHLNDSKCALGSRRDRHQHIGEGEVGLGGFSAIVNDRRMVGIPLILETPVDDDRGYRENLETLRAL